MQQEENDAKFFEDVPACQSDATFLEMNFSRSLLKVRSRRRSRGKCLIYFLTCYIVLLMLSVSLSLSLSLSLSPYIEESIN